MKMKILIIAAIIVFILLLTLLILAKPVKIKSDKDLTGVSSELQEILYLASLAPNSHNIQSWKTVIHPTENYLSITIDEERKLNVVDPKDRELYISLGCYAETMIKSFSAYGYETDLSFITDDNGLRIDYSKKSNQTDLNIIELIKKRHTDKRAFNGSAPVDANGFVDFSDSSAGIYYYPADRDGFELIKSETLSAYTEQAYNEEIAEELSNWLRLSNKEAIENKDGLPAEQLGISGVKKAFYYLFTSHDSAKGESFAKQGISTTEKQLNGLSAFVIVSSENNPIDLILCGMKTVDLWLKLTDANISVQPMSYAIEVSKHRDLLENELAVDNIQMILRIGYVDDYGTNAAIRRDLADYITVK